MRNIIMMGKENTMGMINMTLTMWLIDQPPSQKGACNARILVMLGQKVNLIVKMKQLHPLLIRTTESTKPGRENPCLSSSLEGRLCVSMQLY